MYTTLPLGPKDVHNLNHVTEPTVPIAAMMCQQYGLTTTPLGGRPLTILNHRHGHPTEAHPALLPNATVSLPLDSLLAKTFLYFLEVLLRVVAQGSKSDVNNTAVLGTPVPLLATTMIGPATTDTTIRTPTVLIVATVAASLLPQLPRTAPAPVAALPRPLAPSLIVAITTTITGAIAADRHVAPGTTTDTTVMTDPVATIPHAPDPGLALLPGRLLVLHHLHLSPWPSWKLVP